MPVATLERTAFEVIDGLAQHQRAGHKRAIDECLAADVDGLVAEGFVVVFGQEHESDGGTIASICQRIQKVGSASADRLLPCDRERVTGPLKRTVRKSFKF